MAAAWLFATQGLLARECGPCNLSVGAVEPEVLRWLLEDPDFETCRGHAAEAIAKGAPGPSTHVEKVGRNFVKAEVFYYVRRLVRRILGS